MTKEDAGEDGEGEEGSEEGNEHDLQSAREERSNDGQEEEERLGRNQAGRRRKKRKRSLEDDRNAEEEEEDDGNEVRPDKNGTDDENGEEEQDDDEANADLSLLIVEKAERRRKKKSGAKAAAGLGYVEDEVNFGTIAAESSVEEKMEPEARDDSDGGGRYAAVEEEEEGEVVEIAEPASRSETPEEGELQEDADGNPVLATELRKTEEDESEGKGKKKKRKKKERKDKKERKKKQKGGTLGDIDQSIGNLDQTLVVEVKDGDAEESMVMRKLLRGPRYFDPPEEQGQSCFNCGKVGHLAAACPEGPRLKPCYVCGGFGHDGRDCPQKTECYVCGLIGHIARNCPNKGSSRATLRDGENGCLLCGRPGHEASTCAYSYDAQDLEQVQCYVCKDFGHLCCVVVKDSWPLPVSCYDCGEMGHTGAGCARPRRTDSYRDRDRDRDRGNSTVCFKCGEEGHYARGCSKRSAPWPPPWSPEAQRGSAGNDSSGHNRYSKSRSSSRLPRWMDLQQREPRWTPPRRSNTGDPWTARVAYSSRGADASRDANADEEDIDAYMGPIENFAASPKDGFRKRRKKSFTSSTVR